MRRKQSGGPAVLIPPRPQPQAHRDQAGGCPGAACCLEGREGRRRGAGSGAGTMLAPSQELELGAEARGGPGVGWRTRTEG